nr:polysaccharide deacetylase family protein [Oscillospiraceae bacterium]
MSDKKQERELRLPLVMYHHLLEDEAGCGDYVISPRTLEGDLAYLRDHGYTAVGAGDVLRWLRGETELPDKPIMLTFDDGRDSFADRALPLLEKYGMKAVQAPVMAWAGNPDPDGSGYSCMSPGSIAEAAASDLVELANHSFDMHLVRPRFGILRMEGESGADYRAAFVSDTEKAEEALAAACGYVPRVYAYPFGEFGPEAESMLAGRGYRLAFTCAEQVNVIKRGAAGLTELGRFNRAF